MAQAARAEATTPIATTTDTASGAKRFNVNEVTTPPKPTPTRDSVLAQIVKLIQQKGQSVENLIQQKVKAGQGLTIKGCTVDAGQLRAALAQAKKVPSSTSSAVAGQGNSSVPGRPATVGTAAPPAVAAPTQAAGAGSRWAVAAPTAAALAQKALEECETAEPFTNTIKNVSDIKVAILTKPNTLSHATGEHIAPGEVFHVIARCSRVQDGRTYLRLRRSAGWVSTRSPTNLYKVVLASAENNGSVEPVGCPITFQSRAAQVLSRVDNDGRMLQDETTLKEPRAFRVAGGCGQSILRHPSLSGGTAAAGGTIQAWDEFQSDAVCIVPAEGRVYLRLRDGRGWICERSKGDFSRYVVEPVGFSLPHDGHERRAAPRKFAGLGGGPSITTGRTHAKASVIQRTAGSEYDAESIKAAAVEAVKPTPRCAPLKDEAVVLRSDVELWPKLLGAPRPIKGNMRTALRRLSRFYFRKVKECEEDLSEVEARVEDYARACDGKKVLQAHAEVLRKEISKIEQEWKAAIEKDIAGVSSVPTPKPPSETGRGTVAPVYVLGEAWHCAVVRAQQDDGEGGKSMVQHLGPLRPDATAASGDLQLLAEAVLKRTADGIKEESPPAKKRRSVAEDAD